jgi:hypothetical protein
MADTLEQKTHTGVGSDAAASGKRKRQAEPLEEGKKEGRDEGGKRHHSEASSSRGKGGEELPGAWLEML